MKEQAFSWTIWPLQKYEPGNKRHSPNAKHPPELQSRDWLLPLLKFFTI